MTFDHDIDSSPHPILARITTVLLFLLVQAGAVLLVGLTALFLNVVPGWSAEAPLNAAAASGRYGRHALIAPGAPQHLGTGDGAPQL